MDFLNYLDSNYFNSYTKVLINILNPTIKRTAPIIFWILLPKISNLFAMIWFVRTVERKQNQPAVAIAIHSP